MAETLLTVIGVTLLCMLSPGPDMALVMRNTLAQGRLAGLASALGVLTGNFVHIGYAAFGMGWLLSHNRLAYDVLRYAGALYLLYLGVGGVVSALRAAPQTELPSDPTPPTRRAYGEGVLNNLLNPKGALFYLGVFTQLIRPGTPALQTALLVLAMVSTSTLFWLLFVATLQLPPVRRLIARARRAVDITFGLLLAALAVRVAVWG